MGSESNVLEFVREDDFVQYYLFPSLLTENHSDVETLLGDVQQKVERLIETLTTNYLWHKDPFKLTPRTKLTNCLSHIDGQKDENLPPHLFGVSHYGDNIEDEWFMVYLLQQITKQFPDLIARVYDADGEFLLIEAADYLPAWATPETCQNRVYLREGKLHLVDNTLDESEECSVNEALTIVRQSPSKTTASPEIQNALINKLADFPEKIQSNLHRAKIFVPVMVANILKQKPSLIAVAVQAFCNRDQVDLKACRAMKYFPPENRVNTSVTFTKCLYAMLSHSKYVPDRRTGWNLPPVNSSQYKAHSLGVKVACGFEILVSQAKPSSDFEGDKAWQNYVNSLKDKNYFDGLIEGSNGYTELLNKAKDFYRNHRDTMQYTPAIGQEVLELSRTLDGGNFNEYRRNEDGLVEDDDAWLNISPQELDALLQEKYGQRKFVTVNNNSNAVDFTEKVNNFLNHESGMDGAEFPNEAPVRPPRSKNANKVSFDQPDSKKVNFDPNAFSCAVQNILNFVIPEDDSWDLESGSDMSEYEDESYVKEEVYDEDVKNKMQKYMEEMDRELAGTTIGDSFEKKIKKEGDGFEDIESFEPVDINVNALKNILESYRSQLGEAGPSSNMLGPMGLHLDTTKNE